MKNIRVSLAALLALGGAGIVSAQQVQPPAQARGVHRQPGVRAMWRGNPGMRGALMRGIKLSDAEKTNLAAVRQKYAGQIKSVREQYKPDHQAMRDARKRHDTAAVKALRDKAAPEREAVKRLLEAQRAEIRAALTPANQTRFDANAARIKQRLVKHDGGATRPPALR